MLRNASVQSAVDPSPRCRVRPGAESPFTEVVGGIVLPIARIKPHLVLLLTLMAVMFVTSWCATP